MSRRDQRPLYARLLRLRHLTPSGLLCFVFFEGAIALGALLALAEMVSWWGVIFLPVTVAVMVKLNDLVAEALSRPASPSPVAARVAMSGSGVALNGSAGALAGPTAAMAGSAAPLPGEETTRLPGMVRAGVKRPWAERLEMQHQRVRQSATRRYE
jgi:hypothetical protein